MRMLVHGCGERKGCKGQDGMCVGLGVTWVCDAGVYGVSNVLSSVLLVCVYADGWGDAIVHLSRIHNLRGRRSYAGQAS